MSVKDIFIKAGNWVRSSENLKAKGGLSLKQAVRYMLEKLHVQFVDDCCDEYSNTETITDLEGALSVTKTVSLMNPTDTAEYTLANGYPGQIKYISNLSAEDISVQLELDLLLFTNSQNSTILFDGTRWIIIAGSAVFD